MVALVVALVPPVPTGHWWCGWVLVAYVTGGFETPEVGATTAMEMDGPCCVMGPFDFQEYESTPHVPSLCE